MRISFTICLLFAVGTCHAGIFSGSTYEECVDGVVKQTKFKEALEQGTQNCYEKHIRPKQDKMQSRGWQKPFRRSTTMEIEQLQCKKDGKFQENFFIKCSFSGISISRYSKIKVSGQLKDGTVREFEFKNYAPNAKWGEAPLSSWHNVEIERLDRKSLQVVDAD